MKTPLHLWIFGGLSLFWNIIGAGDYTLTQSENALYLAQFTPEHRTYFKDFPLWMDTSWAIAVWFAVLGSILLLSRKKFAPMAFAIAILATLVSALYSFGLAEVTMTEVVGTEAIWFTLLILVIAVAQWVYARAMRQAGYLR
ncbi:MAG: hypothetical protein WBH04_17690 [Albidovulum sp.]